MLVVLSLLEAFAIFAMAGALAAANSLAAAGVIAASQVISTASFATAVVACAATWNVARGILYVD
jgi:hypothetical protein